MYNTKEELQKPYLYQNHNTNQASSTHISTQQLCRILCPPHQSTSSSSSSTSAAAAAPRMPITADSTLLIAFDPSTGGFSKEGWRTARDTAVLREACGNWYYEGMEGDASESRSGEGVGRKGVVRGPVSCRQLSGLFHGSGGKGDDDVVKDCTRVWSPEMAQQQQQQENGTNDKGKDQSSSNEWKRISELPRLMTAMEAFVQAPVPWAFHDRPPSTTAADAPKENASQQQQVQFDPSVMVYPDDDNGDAAAGSTTNGKGDQESADAALEELFSSTADDGEPNDDNNGDDDDEEYESDGGTLYAKDHRTGNWVHADLLPDRKQKLGGQTKKEADSKQLQTATHKRPLANNNNIADNPRKKKKKKNFKSKNAKNWIYITNLPLDTTHEELTKYFSKVGIIDLDPETQKPKIKLYRYRKGDTITTNGQSQQPAKPGQLKGDASLCYARPESVQLALQILDDSNFRPLPTDTNTAPSPKISVQRAKFTQHGEQYHGNREVSVAKRKVARLAALQAVGWDDEGDNGRITGGLKGLRIIVLKHMFTIEELQRASIAAVEAGVGSGEEGEDRFLEGLERGVREVCERCGDVEKITVFSKNRDGVMVVKFTQPAAAGRAIEMYNGKVSKEHGGRKIEACYWDGVTDFTVRDEAKEQAEHDKRLDDFGNWLDQQELPDEFRLNVEK